MATAKDIAAIQACVTNRLKPELIGPGKIAGVVGAAPSRYSKSPPLWNAAFAATGIQATYLPFDVEQGKLREFAAALRNGENILGVNVTVPHKLAIMAFMDELDPVAARIQAVNTVVRTKTGALVGYNTDGAGFIASILGAQPGESASFVKTLSGADVLLLGAGGSARAVAFQVSELLEGGKLAICNRTLEYATALAGEIRARGMRAFAIGEDELAQWAAEAMLIINCTTKGQGSSSLEAYSALAPALTRAGSAEAAETAIRTNNEASLHLAAMIPKETRFYDLIYHPEETVFLRHARATGHKTMNGRAMIICQAALAFANHVCAEELRARGLDRPDTLAGLITAMYAAW
jgi:shikimate dehydrogenase